VTLAASDTNGNPLFDPSSSPLSSPIGSVASGIGFGSSSAGMSETQSLTIPGDLTVVGGGGALNSFAAVPEPSSIAMALIAVAAIAAARVRRFRSSGC
jgi:hypothetical protein